MRSTPELYRPFHPPDERKSTNMNQISLSGINLNVGTSFLNESRDLNHTSNSTLYGQLAFSGCPWTTFDDYSENLISREEDQSGKYPESQQRGPIKSLGTQGIKLISAFQYDNDSNVSGTPSNGYGSYY